MELSGRPQVSATLPPGTQIPVPTELEAGWVNSRYGRLEKRKSLFALPQFELRIVQHGAQSLYGLRYPGFLDACEKN